MNKDDMVGVDAERKLLDQALSSLQESSGLKAEVIASERRGGIGIKEDALIRLGIEDREWMFPAVVKKRLTNDTLGYVITALGREQPRGGLLVTRHVTPQQAGKLRLANVQFVDTAGNAFLNRPPLYVFVTGNRPAENGPRDKTARAFNAAGVKVLFALLSKPSLVAAPYREIAAAAGVSLGAVSQVLDDLKRTGYLLDRGEDGRDLKDHRKLIDRWGEAYQERLRPKLLISRFSADKPDWWKEARLERMHAYWGGEVAAAKLTGHLKPQVKTIYAPGKLAALQVQFGFRPDGGGDIELLKKFWTFDNTPTYPDAAPPLLVYADLMASGDERNAETAEMIYDRYIARSFGEA